MFMGLGMPIPNLSNLPGPSRPGGGGGVTVPYEFKFEVTAGQVGITILPRVNGQGFTIKWQDETEQTITSAQTDLQSPTTQAGVISINKEGDQTWCDDFAVASGKQFVTKVTSWGQNPWNRLLNAFKDCTNLTEIGTTGLLVDANGSSFNSLFEGCTSLTAINMTNWDLSSGNGASIRKIAKGCVNLEQVDIPSNKKIKFYQVASNEAFRDSGTSTTNGCIFNMQGLDSSTTTTATAYGNDAWFRGCKISPSSNFSNWVFNSSLTYNMNFTFYLAEMTGTNSTLDISGWSTLKATSFGSFIRGFNSNGATPKPDSNFTINVSNLNLSHATNLSLFFGFANNASNVKNIIGLSTLPAMVSASTNINYFIGSCPFLKLTDDDNLSDAFMNSLNSNNASSMFQDLGQSLTLGDYGKAPNLAGLNLSASTTVASMFRKAKLSNAPDFSNVIFPTAAVSYATFAYYLEVSDTDAHLVIDRPTVKPSTLQFAFAYNQVPKVTIGDSVDLSAVTTFQYLFLNAGSVSRPCEVTLPTTADYGGTTLATSWDNLFNGLKSPLGGTQVLSTCVGDTFIRRLHASTLNTNPQSINLYDTKLTGSPSVVNSNVTDLETAGWTITDNSTDAVMPFVYTAPLLTDTTITPTGSFTGGTFSSSNATNIPVNATTGVINTPNAGNTTIRYTLADGCYNEQAISLGSETVSNVYSMAFDGVNDYIDTSSSTVGQLQEMSVSAWFKETQNAVANTALVANNGSTNKGWCIWIDGTNMRWQVADGSSSLSWTQTVVGSFRTYAPLNQWNHVCCTFDGVYSKIYINGILRETWTATPTPYVVDYSGNVGNLTIGRRSYANSGFFRGQIDEVGLFNAALTSSQIEGIYNATAVVGGVNKTADLSQLTTPPVAWYRMGD
tara:strand:+ start:244 stop:2934 length:2691 start_codon:yes stop_codon:yes gene_type:complete